MEVDTQLVMVFPMTRSVMLRCGLVVLTSLLFLFALPYGHAIARTSINELISELRRRRSSKTRWKMLGRLLRKRIDAA